MCSLTCKPNLKCKTVSAVVGVYLSPSFSSSLLIVIFIFWSYSLSEFFDFSVISWKCEPFAVVFIYIYIYYYYPLSHRLMYWNFVSCLMDTRWKRNCILHSISLRMNKQKKENSWKTRAACFKALIGHAVFIPKVSSVVFCFKPTDCNVWWTNKQVNICLIGGWCCCSYLSIYANFEIAVNVQDLGNANIVHGYTLEPCVWGKECLEHHRFKALTRLVKTDLTNIHSFF